MHLYRPASYFNRTLVFFILIVFCQLQLQAQYYNTAFGKNGSVLKTALHNIIKNHTVGTYADLWTDYYSTDNKGSNILWDIYSDIPGGTPAYTFILGTNQCGSAGYSKEGDCYNREHIWPQFYFNGNTPMYTDLQQIYPTDGWVNNKHADLPYGNVLSANWTSQNGCKRGSSTCYTGYSNDVFEPIDSFKGDIARVYFYMSTRYEGEDAGWINWPMATGAQLTSDAITLLLSWHHLDPVSQKEIDRNNAAFTIQGNRNPFIDYPEFADCIWGSGDCSSLSVNNYATHLSCAVYPIPSTGIIHIQTEKHNQPYSYSLLNFQGMLLEKGILSGTALDLTKIASGNYLLLITDGKQMAQKIITLAQ